MEISSTALFAKIGSLTVEKELLIEQNALLTQENQQLKDAIQVKTPAALELVSGQ